MRWPAILPICETVSDHGHATRLGKYFAPDPTPGLDRTGLIWSFKLLPDPGLPVARPLGIGMVSTDRGGAQDHHLAIFGYRFLEAMLLVQRVGKHFLRANRVGVIGPKDLPSASASACHAASASA